MKTFLTINILLVLFSACSYDNAFSRFDISQEREKSEESIVSSKIYNQQSVTGVITCVYLNTVNPQKYKDGEYFYIYLYTKDTKTPMNFTLNDINASNITELASNNEFTTLTDSKVDWQKYYFVKFTQQESVNLKLIATIANFSSNPILFQKEN